MKIWRTTKLLILGLALTLVLAPAASAQFSASWKFGSGYCCQWLPHVCD